MPKPINPNRVTTSGGKLHVTGVKPYDYIGAIIAYESGELDDDGLIELFQYLVDTGLAWSLQGHYGRTARALIDEGYITLRTNRKNT